MPPHYLHHVAFWFVLTRPPLGLSRTFPLLLSSCSQYYYWACSYTILGFLGLFYSFGHPRPVSFPRASLVHSNLSFPWVFAKSFGLLRPKLPYPLLSRFIGFSINPIYLVLSFELLQPIFTYFPFLIMPMGLLLYSGSFGLACFFWVPFTIL